MKTRIPIILNFWNYIKRMLIVTLLVFIAAIFTYFSVVVEDRFKTDVASDFCRVLEVIDGDTFWVQKQDGRNIKIRMIGIDAPETKNAFNKKKHPFGAASKKYLNNLLMSHPFVSLQFDVDSLDQYGRTLAYVYLKDNGIMLNEFMIEKGYAVLMTIPPNVRFEKRFIKAQDKAKLNQAGVWELPPN